MSTEIAATVVKRAEINKEVITLITAARKVLGVKQEDLELSDILPATVISTIYRGISMADIEVVESSDGAVLHAFVTILSDTGILAIRDYLISEDAKEYQVERVAVVARQKEGQARLKEQSKTSEKLLAKCMPEGYEIHSILCSDEVNKHINAVITDTNKTLLSKFGISLQNSRHCGMWHQAKDDTRTSLYRIKLELEGLLAIDGISIELKETLQQQIIVMETELNNLESVPSDMIRAKSGIMVAPMPNVKPRPKFIAANLEDTDKGLVVTFPKPVVIKYGVGMILNLGVMIAPSSVRFEGEYFTCEAIKTHPMLGTMLLLLPTQVDTIKLAENSELGLLISTNK